MNPTEAAEMMAKLGITGIDPTKMSIVMSLAEQLGGEVQVSREELEAYYPEVEDSFYVPKAPKGFYLGDTALLRRLNTPSAKVFRKLLGIRE